MVEGGGEVGGRDWRGETRGKRDWSGGKGLGGVMDAFSSLVRA